MRRFLSSLIIASCFLGSLPSVTLAQNGLTIFSGVKSGNELPYRLDFGGNTNDWDRYRLRIPSRKLKTAVQKFVITYPDYYEGEFDTDEVEIKVQGKKVKVSEVKWDKEGSIIEVYPEEVVPAGKRVELIFSNVKNPSFGGMFYFRCLTQSPGDIPLPRMCGTWIVGID